MRDAAVAEAWGNWISEMGEWHVFGGLTYDQRRRTTVPGRDVAWAHVRRWLGRDARRAGLDIEAAVVALEYQKNGWPHFHPLLRLRGGDHPRSHQLLGQPWFRDHGYARLESPRSRDAVSAYASKYLAKDLDSGDVMFWPTRGPLTTHQPQLLEHQVAAAASSSGPIGASTGTRR
jgi:hypothetical protein